MTMSAKARIDAMDTWAGVDHGIRDGRRVASRRHPSNIQTTNKRARKKQGGKKADEPS